MHNRIARTNRRAVSALIGAASAAAMAGSVSAQTSIQFNGGTYTQNFDTLPSIGDIAFTNAGPHNLSAPPVDAFGMPGWYSADTDNTGSYTLRSSNGTNTAGGLYSFGQDFDPERALGSIASGTVIPGFGAILFNTSGSTISQFTLSYIGEQWRRGSSVTANTLSFSYAVGATSITSGSFTIVPELSFTAPINTGANTALDGNQAANRVAISSTVGGLSWGPNQTLVIRWTDVDNDGFDDGLGIDTLSFFAGAIGPRSLVWNPAGTGGTNWSTNPANTNWLDGASATAFMNGDTSNFTQSGVGAVNIDPAGVLPNAVNVSNTSGVYTFSGGAIGGNGALTKTGAGTVVLAAANAYTGGTVINAGVVSIAADQALGAPSGSLSLGGGTLLITGSLTSGRSVALTGSVSTIDSAADATFTSGVSGAGSFRKSGPATLVLSGPYNISGTTAVTAGTLAFAQSSGSVNLSTTIGGGNFAGNLAINTPTRVNFNGGLYSGGGKIHVLASGATISTTDAFTSLTPTIANEISLNTNNVAGPFAANIGATGGNVLTITNRITGNSDVNFASGSASAGIVALNNTNTYTGATSINLASAGVVRIGVNNALPTGTSLTFGSGSAAVGALNLNGFSQSIASLRSDTTGTVNGIANTAAAPSALTITGSASTSFSGRIGIPAVTTNLSGANNNIALVLSTSHTGTLHLTGINTYTGGTTLAGGTLSVDAATNLGGSTGTVTFNGGALRINGAPFSGSWPLLVNAGAGTIDVVAGPVQWLASVQGPGTLHKTGAGQVTFTNARNGMLHIAQGEVVMQQRATPNESQGISDVGGLSIAGGPSAPAARLDLKNNGMIVGSTPPPPEGGPDGVGPEGDVRDYIQAGFAGGSWTGNGIATSAGTSGTHGLGYSSASALNITMFGDLLVQGSDIVIRFTRYGDANLDGLVNLSDFNRLAANFGTSSGAFWRHGDFNYDGNVNLIDFNRLAANFGLSASPDGPTPEDWSALASVVPEPSAVLLSGVAASAAMVRRRRGRIASKNSGISLQPRLRTTYH